MLIKSQTIDVPPMRTDHKGFLSRLPVNSGEIPSGYAERVARYLGYNDVQSLLKCSAAGITFRDVRNGKQLWRLAAAFDLPRNVFACATIERLSRNRYRLNGVEFGRDLLVKGKIRICRECFLDDLAHQPGPIELRPHQRALSCVQPITCCPQHGVAYLEIDADYTRRRLNFQLAVQNLRLRLPPAIRVGEIEFALSRLLAQRFERNSDVQEPELFQGLPFKLILPVCREVGRLALKAMPEACTTDATRGREKLEHIGCELLLGGPHRLGELLDARFAALAQHEWLPTMQDALGDLYNILRRTPLEACLWRVTRDLALAIAMTYSAKLPQTRPTMSQLATITGCFSSKRPERSKCDNQMDIFQWAAQNGAKGQLDLFDWCQNTVVAHLTPKAQRKRSAQSHSYGRVSLMAARPAAKASIFHDVRQIEVDHMLTVTDRWGVVGGKNPLLLFVA